MGFGMSLTRPWQEELEDGNMKGEKFRERIPKDAIVDFTLAFAIVMMIYIMSLI